MNSSVQTQQTVAAASKPVSKDKSMGDHLNGFMDMFSSKKSAPAGASAAKVGGRSRRRAASRRRSKSASRSRSASRRRSKSRRGGNPDKGQFSMTRKGQDFVTHIGDMTYNRDGHRQSSNSMGMLGSPYGAAKAMGAAKAKTMKKAAAKGAAMGASRAATAAKGAAKAASKAAAAARGASASKAMGAAKAAHAAAGKAASAAKAAAMGASAAAAAHKAASRS